MIPGMYPSIVNSKDIQNSLWSPYLKKTPRGGRKTASRIRQKFQVPGDILSPLSIPLGAFGGNPKPFFFELHRGLLKNRTTWGWCGVCSSKNCLCWSFYIFWCFVFYEKSACPKCELRYLSPNRHFPPKGLRMLKAAAWGRGRGKPAGHAPSQNQSLQASSMQSSVSSQFELSQPIEVQAGDSTYSYKGGCREIRDP